MKIKNELLTIREVATIFRVAQLTLKRQERKGWLHPIRIGNRGDRRYHRDEVINILIGAADCSACAMFVVERAGRYCTDHQKEYDKYTN